jgi:ABC-type uncharacterized transport system ATPase subunit
LDEPTAGFDPVTARRIRQVIREARDGGATVFLTTHDMVTANELCDRVAFLVDGQIAALDSPRSLRLAHGRKVVRGRGASGVHRLSTRVAGGGLGHILTGTLKGAAIHRCRQRDGRAAILGRFDQRTSCATPSLRAICRFRTS